MDINNFNISNFQFIPQTPDEQRLLPVNKWEYPEDAWVQIVNKIRGILIN